MDRIFFLPKRSDNFPYIGVVIAEVRRYREKIQLISSKPFKSQAIVGMAVVTTVPSTAPRNIATISAITILRFAVSKCFTSFYDKKHDAFSPIVTVNNILSLIADNAKLCSHIIHII